MKLKFLVFFSIISLKLISQSWAMLKDECESSGFTVVRPHGGKNALPSYTVNKIINRLLKFIENQ